MFISRARDSARENSCAEGASKAHTRFGVSALRARDALLLCVFRHPSAFGARDSVLSRVPAALEFSCEQSSQENSSAREERTHVSERTREKHLVLISGGGAR